MGGNSLTVFMYPWFGMGHLIPFVGVANKLAEMGHKIILIVPQKAQSRLELFNFYPELIKFRTISIPPVEGLPPQAETSNDIPIHSLHLLFHAMDLTMPVIESLLREIKPHLVFYDMLHWLPGLARSMEIKSVFFSVTSPASMGFLFVNGDVIEDFMNGPVGYPGNIKLNKHEARGLSFFNAADQMNGGLISVGRRLVTAITECDAIGLKTCGEIEGPYCDFLEKKLNKRILLAGPVVPEPKPNSCQLDEKWANWLHKHKPKTVILCALGSEVILEKDQIQELILGIELTGLPFFVALKPPSGADTIDEALPEGFKARTEERGIVHAGWVPQQLMLKHPSVGCFITHCGYGSMWEALMSECQLVALPHMFDQFPTARLVSQVLKVGVEVRRGEEDGSFTKEGVHEALMAVMADGSEVGKEVRMNLEKWRKFLGESELQNSYMTKFVSDLRNLVGH